MNAAKKKALPPKRGAKSVRHMGLVEMKPTADGESSQIEVKAGSAVIVFTPENKVAGLFPVHMSNEEVAADNVEGAKMVLWIFANRSLHDMLLEEFRMAARDPNIDMGGLSEVIHGKPTDKEDVH